MSLDASDWVWTRSTARGTARLVLLAVADKIRDERCVAYAGTAMLVQRTNAARSTVITAVDRLLDAGELAIVEGAAGPRGETCYRLPHAVGHVRTDPDTAAQGGPGTGGVQNPARSGNEPPGTDSGPRGSGIDTPLEVRNPALGGPETTPRGSDIDTPGGPRTGPQNSYSSLLQEQQQPRASARASSPAVAKQLRPLADALDSAGIRVRWTLDLDEQREVWQLAQRHGVEQLVDLAGRRTAPGDAPKSARYWLRVWGDLDDAPTTGQPAATAANGNVVPLRGRPTTHTDSLLAGLALLEQEDPE